MGALTPFVFSVLLLTSIEVFTQDNPIPEETDKMHLPSVVKFEPERYLGKWNEVARLPIAIQPSGTLATAEYSATKEEGKLLVKNTAYDAQGKALSSITGEARIAPGEPPGRLIVSFGPAKPVPPNYYVLHVDKEYQYAVVGVPDRKSLWLLAREVPIAKEKLDELKKIATNAGFDVAELIVAPWEKVKGSQD